MPNLFLGIGDQANPENNLSLMSGFHGGTRCILIRDPLCRKPLSDCNESLHQVGLNPDDNSAVVYDETIFAGQHDGRSVNSQHRKLAGKLLGK